LIGEVFCAAGAGLAEFCSGATYLVFLKTIEEMREDGGLNLDADALEALVIRDGQRDGEGVWGRWNANGPGTARLFHETGAGDEFHEFSRSAKPGDFMRYSGRRRWGPQRARSTRWCTWGRRPGRGGYVRFWSSNIPDGYGEKSVARGKMAQVIFSRLQTPENLERIKTTAEIDPYLASLVTRRSSFAEALQKCGAVGYAAACAAGKWLAPAPPIPP